MNTPLYDFTGLSDPELDLLWFRADQMQGNRELAFATVLAAYRQEKRVRNLEHGLREIIRLQSIRDPMRESALVAHDALFQPPHD